MRPDSKQLAIMKRLTAQLEAINPSNIDPADDIGGPYNVDLRGQVKRGRKVFGKEQRYPFIAILESPQPAPVVGVGYDKVKRKEYWNLLLQGFVTDDKDNPSDPAYDLKAVVEMRLSRIVAVDTSNGNALYPDDYLFGGLIDTLEIGQGVVSPPDEKVSAQSFFYIPLSVCLITDVSKPFSM